jgi:hypothetical protein
MTDAIDILGIAHRRHQAARQAVMNTLEMQAGPDAAIAFQNALVESAAAEADVSTAKAVARDLMVAMIVTLPEND